MEENLNNLEIQILQILEEHRGRGNEISRKDLVDLINNNNQSSVGAVHEPPLYGAIHELPLQGRKYHEREIRRIIKHLVTQHGIAIGSCYWGYFLAETPAEIEEVCKYYDSYGLSSLLVSAKLRKIEMADFLGQLWLRFGNQNRCNHIF